MVSAVLPTRSPSKDLVLPPRPPRKGNRDYSTGAALSVPSFLSSLRFEPYASPGLNQYRKTLNPALGGVSP